MINFFTGVISFPEGKLNIPFSVSVQFISVWFPAENKPYPGMQQGSKIWGGQVVLGGDNVSPLVEIMLTDLPKTGG